MAVKDIGPPITRFLVFSTRKSLIKKTHILKMFSKTRLKSFIIWKDIHVHFSYTLRTIQQVTLSVSRANLNGGFITSGGRGLTVIDASLEFRNQSEPLEWDVLSSLSASVCVRTLPRVQKITLTMVTELFVWLKNVGGRSSELCPWIIRRPSNAAYRIDEGVTQVLRLLRIRESSCINRTGGGGLVLPFRILSRKNIRFYFTVSVLMNNLLNGI